MVKTAAAARKTAKAPRVAAAPGGLSMGGTRLWKSIAAQFGLEEYEKFVLLQACRCADRLDSMAKELVASTLTVTNYKGDEVVHPLIAESRQQSLTLARLLASLRVPSGETLGDQRLQRRGAVRGTYGGGAS
jgi:hypothetical protein